MHIPREVLGRTAVRRFLPVQVLGVLLAVGSLTSVSTPFGIGDVIVRAPIVLTNAAAQVMRAVTDSAAIVSAMGTVRPPRNVAPPHAGPRCLPAHGRHASRPSRRRPEPGNGQDERPIDEAGTGRCHGRRHHQSGRQGSSEQDRRRAPPPVR